MTAADGAGRRPSASVGTGSYQLVVVANRLPVDRVETTDGALAWQRSPGGLVAALEPVLRAAGGAWVGWGGASDSNLPPFDVDGMRLVPVPLSELEVQEHYEGFANGTLWPLYHDVIAPPEFRRRWWRAYCAVNERFAAVAAAQAAPGATVWVHDYQLQLVPAGLRLLRPDLRIGFFNHIPFPDYDIFSQLPWRRQVIEGLVGADLVGFQRRTDAGNFRRACRRAANLAPRGPAVQLPARDHDGWDSQRAKQQDRSGSARAVHVGAFPISIDFAAYEQLARRPDVQARAGEIRRSLGDPQTILLGVDRLDYTKGILHRLRAYEEALGEGRVGPPGAVFVQVATPSRERVQQYKLLRDEVEAVVGRINGVHAVLGRPAVQYLHHCYPREELAALYVAADVMLVTALRDGMNLVAKEYIACRWEETGALVLSEFTGAADELGSAFQVNPHDMEGMKETILHAVEVSPREARQRMRSLRRRVREHDVHHWAGTFLQALQVTPDDIYPAPNDPRPAPTGVGPAEIR